MKRKNKQFTPSTSTELDAEQEQVDNRLTWRVDCSQYSISFIRYQVAIIFYRLKKMLKSC